MLSKLIIKIKWTYFVQMVLYNKIIKSKKGEKGNEHEV